jgi:BASS family bile acid:Na+ symporter
MFKRLTLAFLNLLESYLFIIVLALGAGLLFPAQTGVFTPYTTIFLQIIFFLTGVKLDPKEILKNAKDVRLIATSTVFLLIIFPAIVYLLMNLVAPSMAVGFLLLACMPIGMTAPLLAEVVDGKPELALVLAVISSLLAPITIPIMIRFFASTAVTVSIWTMFLNLLNVILVPLVLAQIVRFFWRKRIKATFFTFKPISTVLLGCIIAGSIAKQSSLIMHHLNLGLLIQLIALFLFVAARLFVGYEVAFWRKCNDRLTIATCLTFMNFTLAIYLAGSYFKDPNVLLVSVLVIIPWTFMLLPFKVVVRKFVCPIKR